MKKPKEQSKKLQLFRKLVTGVGYVWALGLLCAGLFREEYHNLGLYPWILYVRLAILIIGLTVFIYYIWLEHKEK